MANFADRVVFITGGARGQGRSHAVTLAEMGADIVLFDVPAPTPTISYPAGTLQELHETRDMVTALGRRCLALEGDVRSFPALEAAVEHAVSEFGKVDVMLANAGVASYHKMSAMPPQAWCELIDINLTGVFHSIRSVLPHMLSRKYGRIVVTASTMSRMGGANSGHYAASKWGIIGLVKSAAIEGAPHGVTVNAVAPTSVATPLMHNPEIYKLFRPDLENPTWEDAEARFTSLIPQGVPHIEAIDVSKAIAYLASDDARYVTGSVLDVSGGKAAYWSA